MHACPFEELNGASLRKYPWIRNRLRVYRSALRSLRYCQVRPDPTISIWRLVYCHGTKLTLQPCRSRTQTLSSRCRATPLPSHTTSRAERWSFDRGITSCQVPHLQLLYQAPRRAGAKVTKVDPIPMCRSTEERTVVKTSRSQQQSSSRLPRRCVGESKAKAKLPVSSYNPSSKYVQFGWFKLTSASKA